MAWVRGVVCVLALAGLAACSPGGFSTSADLAEVTPRVTPIAAGRYTTAATGPDGGLVIAAGENGAYLLTLAGPNAADAAGETLSIFGPADGFYVAQLPVQPASGAVKSFANFVFRANEDGSLSVVDELAMETALGQTLAAAFEMPPSSVGALTDNAGLNWAILQRAIADHREGFAVAAELVPADEETSP